MAKRKIPLSMTGDNLYSFRCDPTDRICNYTVCQHTVWAYKKSTLKGFADCKQAIDKRECPAIKMMLAEREAGKSLYFESYAALVKEREKRIEAQKNVERDEWRKSRIIATNRTALNEDEIRRRDLAIEAKLKEDQDDTVQARIQKRRKSETVDLNADSGNMFAEVVNALAAEES